MSKKYYQTLNGSSLSTKSKKIFTNRRSQSRKIVVQRKNRRFKVIIFSLFFLLFVFLITYFLFFSKYFRINNIEINKIEDYNLTSDLELNQEISILLTKKRFVFPQNSILAFNSKNLSKIMNNDSRYDEFFIEKKWPHTLIIKIKESKPVAFLISFGNYQNYYLNEQGKTILKPQNNELFTTLESGDVKVQQQEQDFPIFYDQTEINLNSEEYQNLLKSIITFINNQVFSKNNLRAEIIKITEKEGIFEIIINTNEKWQIFINSEADFEKQAINLNLILQEKIQQRTDLEYIDLRFGEKIFYQ